MPGRITQWGIVGATLVALAVVPSCGEAVGAESDSAVATTTPPPDPQLLLTFDDQEPGSAAGRDIQGEGSAAAVISLLGLGKQTATFVKGHQGGIALRMPTYSGEATGSYSALRIEPEEWLSPGVSDFAFGVDLRLDAHSNGTAIDNGDNVMQRGLYADAAQYKIQVDKHHASCVIRGADGAVVVKSKALLNPSKWYRLTCRRTDKTVTHDGPGPRLEPASGDDPEDRSDRATGHDRLRAVGRRRQDRRRRRDRRVVDRPVQRLARQHQLRTELVRSEQAVDEPFDVLRSERPDAEQDPDVHRGHDVIEHAERIGCLLAALP